MKLHIALGAVCFAMGSLVTADGVSSPGCTQISMDGGIGFSCWSNCSPDNDGSGNGKRNQGSTTWREGNPWCYLKKPNGDGVNCNFKSECDDSTFECMNKEDNSKLGGCG